MVRHKVYQKKKDLEDMTKYYIITRPTPLSDVDLTDLDDNANWRNQSQQLQARRWKKLRHQLI